MARVVIIGGGIIGAACAFYAADAGLDVCVVEHHAVAAGTTGAGEGNVLLSDKAPGADLSMALRALQLWGELGERLGGRRFEMERKGSLVVAATNDRFEALDGFAAAQRAAGVRSEVLGADRLREVEPHLNPRLVGGVLYPDDTQVQPMLAAACLLRAAVRAGASLRLGVEVIGLQASGRQVTGVVTNQGLVAADWVVNAAGPWAGDLSKRLGAAIPIAPRRGLVLVTEPLPRVVRHTVMTADYVANVASSSVGLETAAVIEGTRSGPVLIGASRERVGFDRTLSVPIVRRLATQAVALLPMLAKINLMRVYQGFRPYSPDHLPVVGHDKRVPGLLQACGHEGAGIGLAPATGELVTQLILGQTTTLAAEPFCPDRLTGQPA